MCSLAVFALHPLGGLAAEPAQQVACEISGLNHAWGFQYMGVYIDPTGTVGEFNYSSKDSQWASNRGEPLTQSDLREKYRPGNRVLGKVCPDQMIWLRDELNKVRYSPVSKPTHVASDAGVQSTQCWMFGSEAEPGQNVRLRETGDFESRNLAESAPALANWLEAVAQDARKNAHVAVTSKGCIAYPESLNQQYDETIEQTPEERDRAMKMLTAAEGLRCRMGEGRWFGIYGTKSEQRATPENFEMNYFQLDAQAGEGRVADGGNEVQKVKVTTNVAGIRLEDNPMDNQEVRTMTVAPYRIGGQNRFPAVMHEIVSDTGGLIATTYVGSCTVIPRP